MKKEIDKKIVFSNIVDKSMKMYTISKLISGHYGKLFIHFGKTMQKKSKSWKMLNENVMEIRLYKK